MWSGHAVKDNGVWMSYEWLWWKVVGHMAARQMTGCDRCYAFCDECGEEFISSKLCIQ